MSDTAQLVSRDDVAADFGAMFAGALPDHVIDQAVSHIAAAPLAATTASYSAKGSIASVIVWMKCQCTISGGKTFDGSSWGITFPGGGALMGDVYTDDLQALYANTQSFALVATPVYTSFVFFDGNSNTLGSFQAGSVSTVAGTGGGGGSWS